MQIIKPDNLGLLFNPCMIGNACIISVAIMACFPLCSAPGSPLLEESAMWDLVAKSLGENESLDMGYPKHRGEFLVYGSCHSPVPVPGMHVGVTVGTISKSLQVTGRRYWNAAGVPGEPELFREIPVCWTNAFGGEGYEQNPEGTGFVPDKTGNRPLPLVQDPHRLITSSGNNPEPAGFTAINQFWPQRSRFLGSFDDRWLRTRWPHYPHDTAPEYFNTAPPDQRLSGYFRGDEPLHINNMHPEHPLIESRLPGLRARLFLNQSMDVGQHFVEVETRAETLWIFPGGEAAVLLYRGAAHVADETLDDVLHLMAAWEPLDSDPLPYDFYRRQFAELLSPPPPPPEPVAPPPPPPTTATAEAPAPPPPPLPEEPPPSKMAAEAEKQMENLNKKLAEIDARTDAVFAKLGLTREEAIEKYLPKPKEAPRNDIAELEKLAADLKAGINQNLASKGFPSVEELIKQQAAKGPADPQADIRKAIEAMKNIDSGLVKSGSNIKEAAAKHMPHLDTASLDMGAAIAGLEQLAAMIAAAPPPAGGAKPPEEMTEPVPEPPGVEPENPAESDDEIIARLQKGETLCAFDLTGRNFKGARLAGARFHNCILEGASFADCHLEGADFSGSILSGADFSNAFMERASMTGVVAIKSIFVGTDLRNSNLCAALFSESLFDRAKLSGASLSGSQFNDASFMELRGRALKGEKASFSGANFTAANLDGADVRNADFSRALLDKVSMREVIATGAAFYGAQADAGLFYCARLDFSRAEKGTCFKSCNLAGASLKRACWEGASFNEVRMENASLDNADFSRCRMDAVFLFNASLKESNFMKAEMDSCDLRGANFFKATFRHALFHKCDLKESLFFGADLYGASIKESDTRGTDFSRIQCATEA